MVKKRLSYQNVPDVKLLVIGKEIVLFDAYHMHRYLSLLRYLIQLTSVLENVKLQTGKEEMERLGINILVQVNIDVHIYISISSSALNLNTY